jgi:hypothetical protein
MTAGDIIDRLGGTSVLARELALSVSTVDSWRTYNRIPDWRQESILKAALSAGIHLSTADFPRPEERINPRKAAA